MNTRTLVLLPILAFTIFSSIGQVANLGNPKSWQSKSNITDIPSINMPSFNLESYRYEDSLNDIYRTGPWRFGHKNEVNYSLTNSGVWTNLPNGDRIWRLRVRSKDALSLNFIFEDMYIPNGASIHIYKTDKSAYIGAYTSINNNGAKILGTDIISGSDGVIEYYEPRDVEGQGTLTVATIVHGYRDVSLHENQVMKALNSSADCNRDILCLTNPEPLWLNESKSVAMIIVNGSGSCSGTLVNNTAQDGTPYFLTANHCLGDPATWAFRFKWISPNPSCATTTNSTDMQNNTQYQTAYGSTLRASNAGSDMALVQITNLTLAMAQEWGLFYAGWDHTGNAVTGAIGIHHPSGDIMKYARENQALTKEAWQSAQCWRVSDWDEGVTEPGSSGSGLWDLNHRLIGQLYGGGAACSGTNDNGQPDWYGRMDVSWNGTSAATRLRDWLDPSGISTGTLDGWDPNAATIALDAGIQSVTSPTGILCQTGTFSPEVVLRNFGTTTLTSVTIEYSVAGGTLFTYNWTGSLATNGTASITLPEMTAPDGNQTLTVSTVNPNGGTDENNANNTSTSNFSVSSNGQLVDMALTLDCWGSETSWVLRNAANETLYTGGPYTDGTGGTTMNEQWCLGFECYTFVINDTYGDGMYGSQYGSCTVNGTYTITHDGNIIAQTIAANSNFGNQESNPFCILNADFESSTNELCANSTVSFTDLSQGEITTWNWVFEGGTPATSTEQNPVITYNSAGVYQVSLTIGGSSSTLSETKTGFITVNPSPEAVISTSGVTTFCEGGSVTLTSSSETGNVWSTGATTSSIVVDVTGDYSVTVTNENNCEATSAVVSVVVNSNPTIALGTVTAPINCGEASGSIDILGSGSGVLNWSGAASGNANVTLDARISDLVAGSYTISFEGENGCVSNEVSTSLNDVGAPETPTVLTSGSTTFCQGESITLTSSSATNNTWSTGETTQEITVNSQGEFYVTVSDGACSATSSTLNTIVHATPATPVVSANGATTFCEGGTVTLTSSSETGNVWSTGATTSSIVVDVTGDYSVTVTNENNCEATSAVVSVVVNSNPIIALGTVSSPINCGEATGSIEITGTGTGTLTWTGSGSGSVNTTLATTISDLAAGSYTFSFVEENGCASNEVSTSLNDVGAPETPTILASGSTTFCQGESITLTSSNATNNTWSTGETTQEITVNSQDGFYVTVSDGACSSTSSTLNTTVNAIPSTPVITTNTGGTIFCEGGSLTLLSSSEVNNIWSTMATSQSIVVDVEGVYTVTVTENNCTSDEATISVSIAVPEEITIVANGPVEFCEGGSVVLTSSLESGNLWSTGATSQSITVTQANNYNVTSTDGCASESNTIEVVVNQLPATPVISSSSNVICYNSSLDLTSSATNNTWSTNETTQTITVTEPGTYTVTVESTDNTCTSSSSITVAMGSAMSVATTMVNELEGNDGSISITINGGQAPYSFSWSNSSIEQNQTGLAGGEYTVTVTDANNCSYEETFVLNSELGLNMADASSFSIYPNPTTGNVTIKLDQMNVQTIVITDALGKQVSDLTTVENSEMTIDLSSYEKGVYFARFLMNDNTLKIERIVLQ
jgi:lysyl endopeptidase